MSTHRQSAAFQGRGEEDNANAPEGSKPIRLAGLLAMVAGLVFAGIQPIHPPDILAAVTTGMWTPVHLPGVAMCFFGLLGTAGLYAWQASAVGWLGLAGYLLLSLFFALTLAFQLAEAFLLPPLAPVAPRFVEGVLGILTGAASEVRLGALPALHALTGVSFILGGLLFGIATVRAGILPRWAGGLLAAGGPLAALVGALLPHALERYAAVPTALALTWLGYALWSEPSDGTSIPTTVDGDGRSRPRERKNRV